MLIDSSLKALEAQIEDDLLQPMRALGSFARRAARMKALYLTLHLVGVQALTPNSLNKRYIEIVS
ncbi:MAG: hypothetical protein CMM47_02990 [Rhodospirillaceae bacterium]|nr:hypothetical protein [Rhodospirillaceae bacterium]